ncbi:alpha/beta hydrolase family esterase [Streptomyces iconiensis]|uniref:Polyhydroxybutyrate depolymerase n=1 Tax=Streptomyces iconiensis TaxID=1384038 RepID=A0ABT6ZPG6_9ACTN|nr:polyhydroxybutyrate depolymerase [Streptomyces iconiensis]MDJ1130940.1 polyhydroxybutyrate depolymerase [Streptomyces iconiensis]
MRTRLSLLALATVSLCLVPAHGALADKPSGPQRPASDVGTPRPGDQQVELVWKGKKRTFRAHAPRGYTPHQALPLVVAMHPYPSDGAYVRDLSALSAKADKEKFLVVYPDGLNGGFNALMCCGNEDDVGFLRKVVKGFKRVWNANPDRVYATGISNGGDMSMRLAVELPHTFAAVAPVSSGFIGKALEDDTYRPRTPVSVVTFLGGTDSYYGQFQAGMTAWHQRLKCRRGPVDTLPDGNTRTRSACPDGSRTTVYTVPAMGQWPGSPDPYMGDPAAGLHATDVLWDFFEKHPRARK